MDTTGPRPLLAVTLGDPAGIGPEIVARTLADPETSRVGRGIAVGDAAALRRAVEVCRLPVAVRSVARIGEATFEDGTIEVLDLGISGPEQPWGQVDATAGRSAIAAIERAAEAALAQEVEAIVTAPINKEAIWAAGSRHLGHTEMLGELTGSKRYATMFVVRDVKIFFTTRHMSLRNALSQITRSKVEQAIQEAVTALRVFGHDRPRLAVAALNPHAGENGNFGDEELVAIGPAVEHARTGGLQVTGPVPADSVFHLALQGRYDGVLSHFHDQGHIAAKTYDFDGTIAVTAGLPILRTSVDHGTAFDIAGTGTASYATMASAFHAAARFAPFADRIRAEYGGASV